jgi:anti-anti-sigma factor
VTDTHTAGRPGPLSIDHTAVGDIRVLTLRGEIDHAVRNELTEALLSYDGAAPPMTVMDLSGVTFMDSSGINVLIQLADHQLGEVPRVSGHGQVMIGRPGRGRRWRDAGRLRYSRRRRPRRSPCAPGAHQALDIPLASP